jgi:uncharacterized protein YndB with AHSA1/START domain
VTDKLEFTLQRSVLIRARRSTVFRYFTDSERFARWWGAGSRIEPRPGGEVYICYPGGVVARGNVVAIDDGKSIVFTYGYDDPTKPIVPGGSRVTITLSDDPRGTLVELRHDVADPKTRDDHDPGWRFQLALFANVVTQEQHAGFKDLVASWFLAWSEADTALRRGLFEKCTLADVSFADQYACITGREELVSHVDAARRHLPGVALAAEGEPRQCQGTVLVDWVATGHDGKPVMRGTNVFSLDPGGSIERVVGLPR